MKHISIYELRRMTDCEGLILQGCGGDPKEWLDGINGLLTEQGILLDGDRFKEISVFEHNGNIFYIMGIASRTLKDSGMADAAKEMRSRVMGSGSYDAALTIIMEYVEPVEADGHRSDGFEMRM